MIKNDKRKQILYEKTDFNNHNICQLSTVIKCCKCKKNNSVITFNSLIQNCIFCGTPNYVNKK
jgi:hypothetical protein